MKAVENINTEISEAVLAWTRSEQAFLDKTLIDLDGTENKSRLGANAMLAVSMAVARAAPKNPACPVPLTSAAWADADARAHDERGQRRAHANNNLDLQELMIIPVGAPSFREAIRYGAEVFHALKKIITTRA